MKRFSYFTALTVASLLTLAATACSATREAEKAPKAPAATASTATRKPATTPPPEQVLGIPAGVDYLVEPIRQTGDLTLSFNPRTKVFSLAFVCTGGGQYRVLSNGEKQSSTTPCDGVVLRGVRLTEGGPQTLRIDVDPDTTWQLAVVEGDPLPGVKVNTDQDAP